MKCVVGLGNPGMKYALSKHNIGFWVIDLLSKKWSISVHKEKFNAQIGEGFVNGEKIYLMKPMTYMNLSGEAVRPFIDWVKVDLKDLIIIYDDPDLLLGQIRLREKGSSGGHNGVKSIISHLGTDQFKRIKIGIGKPSEKISVSDYVLSPFLREDLETMKNTTERASQSVEQWIQTHFLEAMNKYNS